MEDRYLRLPT